MRQPRDGARADNDIIVDNNEAKPYKMIYIARHKRILKQFGTKRSQVQILSPRPQKLVVSYESTNFFLYISIYEFTFFSIP